MHRFIIATIFAAAIFSFSRGLESQKAHGAIPSYAVGAATDPANRIYTLLIGINEYGEMDLRGCINDVHDISEKICKDLKCELYYDRPPAKQFILVDREATLNRIKNAIDSIAKAAGPEDTFVFMFAGYSSLTADQPTCLYLSGCDIKNPAGGPDTMRLPLTLLAQWFSQIPCDNQVIISEAGAGEVFTNALIQALFEQNSFISAAKERSRTIVTTNGLGAECLYGPEQRANGPLAHFLCAFPDLAGSLFGLQQDSYDFELQLMRNEMKEKDQWCSSLVNSKIYSRVYYERSFQQLFQRLNYSNSRGVKLAKAQAAPDGSKRKLALLLGTDIYKSDDWSVLRNPINDAKVVADILHAKYGYDTIQLFNQERDTILKKIAQMRLTLDSTDEVFVFVAGHGYYNTLTGCGHIIPINGESPDADQYTNASYLHWNDLKSMFDTWPARNVFVVLDVCFGGKFDNITPAARLMDYKSLASDLTPAEFHERKSKYYSRMFLASGSTSVPDYWGFNTKHSPFAGKLIDVLQNANGFVTPGQIYTQMQMNITEPELHTFGRHDAMNGEFVMVPK